jgi:uncharacterized protein YbbK (DUF523 family)
MIDASRTILVSSCLLGLKTRYDAKSRIETKVINWLQAGGWIPIPVCPEQLGGLSTPRPKAEFATGDGETLIAGLGQLINATGDDVTSLFLHGAEQTAEIAKHCGCSVALLKERSPSCGVHAIYRDGTLTKGSGVTAAYLKKIGLQLFSEENIIDGHLKKDEV